MKYFVFSMLLVKTACSSKPSGLTKRKTHSRFYNSKNGHFMKLTAKL